MEEKRIVSRHRTYLRGVISRKTGTMSEDCVVRNLTDRGALIEQLFPGAPDTFDLLVPDRASRHVARVVWRSGLRVGVRFVPSTRQVQARTPLVATFEGV